MQYREIGHTDKNLIPSAASLQPAPDQTFRPVSIYYSFAREDLDLLDKLDEHLAVLQQLGQITTWHDGRIQAGSPMDREQIQKWEEAQLIILLISPYYVGSCYAEMEAAIHRAEAGMAHIIPVLVRPISYWDQTPIGRYAPLPANGRAITEWRDRASAYKQVADGIGSVVEQLVRKQQRRGATSRLLRDRPPLHSHTTILQRDALVGQIASKLLQPTTSLLMLTGMAGIGKSQLASQFYHAMEHQRQQRGGHFTDKALWFSIRPTTTAHELISTICSELSPILREYQHLSPQELALEFVDLLSDDQHCRLIVLDNVEAWLTIYGDILPTAHVIEECLPLLNERHCASRIVITSRIKPRTKRPYKQMHIQEMTLHGFSQKEGVGLLRLWKMQGRKNDLERAVAKCKGHAMALMLLDNFLQTYHISLATLLNDSAYQRLFTSDLERTLFNDLYTAYSEQQQLLLAAFSIYREAVPFGAIHAITRHVALLTEEQTLQGIGFLRTQGLLFAHPGNEECYELHPLVVEFVHARLTEKHLSSAKKKEQLHHAAAYYYQNELPARWQRAGMDGIDDVHSLIEAAWQYCKAQQWQQGYEIITREHLFVDLLRWGEYAVLLELYTLLSFPHSWQSESTAAQILHELGEIYNGLGQKHEALTSFENALALYRQVGSQEEIVRSLNNAGSLHRQCGQLDQAFAYYREALQSGGEIQEVEKGITLNNLGHAYQDIAMKEQDAQGRAEMYAQALLYYEQALVVHQELGERAEIGRTLNNLGEVYARLEKWEQAQECYLAALEQFRATLERRSEGIVLNNLGTFYRKKDDMENAFVCYVQSLQIFRVIGARWEEATVLKNLGRLHVLLQRMDVALAFFLLASSIYEGLHDPERVLIPRGLQRVLAGEQSFKQAVAKIRPHISQLVGQVIENRLYRKSVEGDC